MAAFLFLAWIPGLASPHAALEAQTIELRVFPSVGVLVPTSVLYETEYIPGAVLPARAELGRAPVFGIGIQAVPSRPLFSVRAALARTVSLETEVTGRDPLVGAPEDTWPSHRYTVPTAVTTLTGDVVLHPDRREFRTDPYLFVGLGWKWYSFGDEDPEDEVGFDFPRDGSSAHVHYGAGLELPLSGMPVAAEIGGSFNRFVLVDAEQGISRARSQHEFTLRLKAFPFGR